MIDPEKLRRRLDEVWAGLGHQAGAEGHEVMRACALTLIAVADAGKLSETASETLAELMRQHPSRAILVRLAAGQADVLEADVEARCWTPFGTRRQICSEVIAIDCSEKTLGDLPGVILSLVVADLPVVLWCASDRARRLPAFASLAQPAGRIILDSVRAERPLELLASLKATAPSRDRKGADPSLSQEPESPLRSRLGAGLVADLSWTRLTRWRSLLAQAFENELYRKQISRFSKIIIHCEGAGNAAVPPTALLLAGWLLSRLGWKVDAGLPPGLQFERRSAGCRPARLCAFELHSPDMSIAIARSGESLGEVRVEMAGLEPVRNRVSLPRSTDVLLLGEELNISRPDPIFEESLEWAVRLGIATNE